MFFDRYAPRIQWNGENFDIICEFLKDAIGLVEFKNKTLRIYANPEQVIDVNLDEWIVKGTNEGEYIVIRQDFFKLKTRKDL